jgi:hypothetical protein
MTNRSGRSSSTIIATIAVSVAVATIQVSAADAAEKCLTTPKAETPTGQHWFYRIEPGTKRHCWYLGDEGKTSSQVPTSTSARRAAPDPSPTSNKAVTRSTADARAELQIPQALTENDRDLAVPSESPTPAVAPDSSEHGAPVSTSTANPDRSSGVTGLPQLNGVASSASTPPTTLAMEETNASDTNTDATTETTVTSAAIAATESEYSVIGTTRSLIGLTLIILGALILLGLSGSAIYRLVEGRAKRRSYSNFGREPTDGAQRATQSQLDVDDNLRQMRELLGRLKHEAQPKREDAVAQLHSGQL